VRKLEREKQNKEKAHSSKKDAVHQNRSNSTLTIKPRPLKPLSPKQETTKNDNTHNTHIQQVRPSQAITSLSSASLRIPKKQPSIAPVGDANDAKDHLRSLLADVRATPSTSTSAARVVPDTHHGMKIRSRARSLSCVRSLKSPSLASYSGANKDSLAGGVLSKRPPQPQQVGNSFSPVKRAGSGSAPINDAHSGSESKFQIKNVKPKLLILTTGLKRAQKQEFDTFIRRFGSQVASAAQWTPNATHLVTSATLSNGRVVEVASQTPKYYKSIIAGIWLVCFDWLSACLNAGELVDEHACELAYGASKSRVSRQLHRTQPRQRLFDNLAVVIWSSSRSCNSSDRQLVTELMIMGGAQMVSSLDDLIRSRDTWHRERKKLVFIYHDDEHHLTSEQQNSCQGFGVSTFKYHAVFASISNYDRMASSAPMSRLSHAAQPNIHSHSDSHNDHDRDRKARSRSVAPSGRARDEHSDRYCRSKSVAPRHSHMHSVDSKSHATDDRNISRNRYARSRSAAPDREMRKVRRSEFEQGKLWVGGLDRSCNDQVLRDYFGKFGHVQNAEVRDSRCFGYVTFVNPHDARMVINKSRDKHLYINDVRVRVDWARDPGDRSHNSFRTRSHHQDYHHHGRDSHSSRNHKRPFQDDHSVDEPDMKRRKYNVSQSQMRAMFH